jgi:hypothetical protein
LPFTITTFTLEDLLAKRANRDLKGTRRRLQLQLSPLSAQKLSFLTDNDARNRSNQTGYRSKNLVIPSMEENYASKLENSQTPSHAQTEFHYVNKPLISQLLNLNLASRPLLHEPSSKRPSNPICHDDYSRAPVWSCFARDFFFRPSKNC